MPWFGVGKPKAKVRLPDPYLTGSRKFGLWDAVGEPFVFEGPNLEDTFPESLASSVANGVPIG